MSRILRVRREKRNGMEIVHAFAPGWISRRLMPRCVAPVARDARNGRTDPADPGFTSRERSRQNCWHLSGFTISGPLPASTAAKSSTSIATCRSSTPVRNRRLAAQSLAHRERGLVARCRCTMQTSTAPQVPRQACQHRAEPPLPSRRSQHRRSRRVTDLSAGYGLSPLDNPKTPGSRHASQQCRCPGGSSPVLLDAAIRWSPRLSIVH